MKKSQLLFRDFQTWMIRGIALSLGIGLTGLVAGTLSNGIFVFTQGETVSASEINSNFTRLVPIGTIIAWHKSLAGVPAADGAVWVECNGQTLNDAASPLNGQVIPNLNGAASGANSPGTAGKFAMFLRGGTSSGTGQMDQFQGHHHDLNFNGMNGLVNRSEQGGAGALYNNTIGGNPNNALIVDPIIGNHGAVRFGTETRPVNMSVVWIMRVK